MHGDAELLHARGQQRPRSDHAHVGCAEGGERVYQRARDARMQHVSDDGYREPGEVLLRSEEHTSELQSPCNLVCRLLLEKKKTYSRSCDRKSTESMFTDANAGSANSSARLLSTASTKCVAARHWFVVASSMAEGYERLCR